ncbi:MAG: ABC transporter permease [Deltaproteobacteria bacterium RBG_13_43_22]|nr:MAG: ABC transporter permease [Deltaproteobacteria bacterium RBG_13_43_22]
MKGFKAVFKREMYAFFASPVFYVVGTIFLILSGYFFYTSTAYFSLISFQAAQNPYAGQQVNLNEMVVKPLFDDLSIILLLIVPLLTMRLLAEEKKNGTIELLLTYPVRELAVLLGKYLATLLVIVLLLAFTAVNIFVISRFGVVDWGPVLSGYSGMVLMAAGFVSLGLFTSALTQNQIVAAILGFGALLMFWIIGWIGSVSGPGIGQVVNYLSMLEHLEPFTKGVLDSRDIMYYFNFSLFFIFLTLRYLDSQKIRG